MFCAKTIKNVKQQGQFLRSPSNTVLTAQHLHLAMYLIFCFTADQTTSMYPVCFVEKFRFFIYSGIISFQKICISSYPFSMFLIILYFNLYSEALHTHRFRLTDTYMPRTPSPSQMHRPCSLLSSPRALTDLFQTLLP